MGHINKNRQFAAGGFLGSSRFSGSNPPNRRARGIEEPEVEPGTANHAKNRTIDGGIPMRALLLISLAFATAASAEQVQKFSATVSPGGHHEECVKMDKGE